MVKKGGERRASLGHDHADVVVDTNVLAHSENPNNPFHADSLDFLAWLGEQRDRYWAMDDNGKAAPVLDTSLLWCEYRTTLAPTATALLLFAQLLQAGRVCFADRPNQQQRQRINKLVPHNRKDRVVLGTAVNSGSRWLVTSDENDFSADVRTACARDLGVLVSGVSTRPA
jgi:hypothetical protein